MTADQEQTAGPSRTLYICVRQRCLSDHYRVSVQPARDAKKTIAWSEDMTWSPTSRRSGSLASWLRRNDCSGEAFSLTTPFIEQDSNPQATPIVTLTPCQSTTLESSFSILFIEFLKNLLNCRHCIICGSISTPQKATVNKVLSGVIGCSAACFSEDLTHQRERSAPPLDLRTRHSNPPSHS